MIFMGFRKQVKAYLQAGITYSFPARSQTHAREIANRIIIEGLWVIKPDGEPEGTELWFPPNMLAKVKVTPADKA
jgi:hypothetical protein